MMTPPAHEGEAAATASKPTLSAAAERHIRKNVIPRLDGLEFVPDFPDKANERCRIGALRATRTFSPGEVVMKDRPYFAHKVKFVPGVRLTRIEKQCHQVARGIYSAAKKRSECPKVPEHEAAHFSALVKFDPAQRELMKDLFPTRTLEGGEMQGKLDRTVRAWMPPFVKALSKHYIPAPGQRSTRLTDDELLQMHEILRCHAYEFEGKGRGNEELRAIFVCAMLVPHSCAPNVVVRQEGFDLVFRAVREIETGELLSQYYSCGEFISKMTPNVVYGEMKTAAMPTALRRAVLSFCRDVHCECDRCMGDDTLRALPCPQEGCGGYVHHSLARQVSGEPDSGWKCHVCGFIPPADCELLRAEKKYADLTDILQPFRFDLASFSPQKALAGVEMARKELGERHWYFNFILTKAVTYIDNPIVSVKLAVELLNWRIEVLSEQPFLALHGNMVDLCNTVLKPLCSCLGKVFGGSTGQNGIATLRMTAISLVSELEKILSPFEVYYKKEVGRVRRILLKYCNQCGLMSEQICSRCKGAAYCGKEHQHEHWQIHKHACNPK